MKYIITILIALLFSSCYVSTGYTDASYGMETPPYYNPPRYWYYNRYNQYREPYYYQPSPRIYIVPQQQHPRVYNYVQPHIKHNTEPNPPVRDAPVRKFPKGGDQN